MLAFSQFDFIVRYFFLVLLALILLGLFNGLVFLPVLLVIVGPPAHVVPTDNQDSLPPCTPEPAPVKFKVKPPKVRPCSGSSRSEKSDHSLGSHKPRRHNSDISLSTIAEETHSHASSADSVSSYSDREQDPGSVRSSLNGGTSVFLEPHITVETSTVPGNGASGGSSRCSSPSMGSQVTKVTATAKFKLELHTPMENSRPASRRSRRSSNGSSRNGDCSTNSSLDNPLRSSGENSLASSLSSDGGYSEK